MRLSLFGSSLVSSRSTQMKIREIARFQYYCNKQCDESKKQQQRNGSARHPKRLKCIELGLLLHLVDKLAFNNCVVSSVFHIHTHTPFLSLLFRPIPMRCDIGKIYDLFLKLLIFFPHSA